jgi:Fis family transcriptional regulator
MSMEQQKITVDSLNPVHPDKCPGDGVGPIRACVTEALGAYFRQLNGHACEGLYKLVLAEVELPLLETVMRYCGGNQTRASQVLGINRGTLRKKLQQYGLDQ